jgi:hypothetical protein
MDQRLSAFATEWINVGVLYRRENENERMGNRADGNPYYDQVNIMEQESSFCRASVRGEATVCVTFYMVYIKFTYFLIVYFDFLTYIQVSSLDDTQTTWTRTHTCVRRWS